MLFKKYLLLIGIIVLLGFVAGCGEKRENLHAGYDHSAHQMEQEHSGMHKKAEEGVGQKTCPVMGEPINKNLYVDHEGKRIYVCCESCLEEVKKDPAKYIKKLEDKGEKVEKI